MILLLLGPPGSGKGTQGRRLSDHFQVPYLASGDLLRRAIAQDTPFGHKVKEYLDRGLYVPDEIMVPAAIQELRVVRAHSTGNGVILDGFPRTREQAEATDRALAAEQTQLDRVLFLNVTREVLFPRLVGRRVCDRCGASYHVDTHRPKVDGVCDRCGGMLVQRPDDRPEMVDERLDVYFRLTLPLVEYYTEQGKLVQVNGDQAEGTVTQALIAAALGQTATPASSHARRGKEGDGQPDQRQHANGQMNATTQANTSRTANTATQTS